MQGKAEAAFKSYKPGCWKFIPSPCNNPLCMAAFEAVYLCLLLPVYRARRNVNRIFGRYRKLPNGNERYAAYYRDGYSGSHWQSLFWRPAMAIFTMARIYRR
jgi:hypothetical protein